MPPEYKSGRAQNELLPEHVERIYGSTKPSIAWRSARVTPRRNRRNDYNLTSPIRRGQRQDGALSVDEAMRRLRVSAEPRGG